MRNLRLLDDSLLVEVCSRFINGDRPTQIAEWLNTKIDDRASREEIYPLIREAIRRGYFSLLPPVSHVMSQRIADRYRSGRDKDRIHVVGVTGESARDLLPAYAADLIASRIKELGVRKKRVGIGLGGGRTIMRIAQSLSARLRSTEQLPQLGLHVLTAGFVLKEPRTAPVTFLGFFDQVPTHIDYVGLFAPAAVDAQDYERVRTLPGVEESFRSAQKIDLVVTSLASAKDEHGELHQFMRIPVEPTKSTFDALRKAGWVGDLQYHPYSSAGPITDVSAHVRAVSLFDLEDLRKLAARSSKYVIVVAVPCGTCGVTKHEALRPLLENDSLKVWTDVVMDLTTAEHLLEEPR